MVEPERSAGDGPAPQEGAADDFPDGPGASVREDSRSDEGWPDERGAFSTLGPSDSSVLGTLAQSIGRLPHVRLPGTRAENDGESREGPGDASSARRTGAAGPAEAQTNAGSGSGRLQLFGVLGRGGMGVVLRARDNDLGRDLAVKVLRESFRDQPDMVRRFVEEAQIGGQLQHPGIVPVYELGCLDDNRPYIAMRLVQGRTFAELLAARGSPGDDLPRMVAIFESVCQTMAYAHARGVIHRDLKPSNIMVGSFGEVQVMDWGLAKVLAVDDPEQEGATAGALEGLGSRVATGRTGRGDASRPGSVLGTPAYMAPEQARGEVATLTERADVFALGSILCEVLTGRPAYAGADWAEIEQKAARGAVGEAIERLSACGAEPELTDLAADCLAPAAADRPRDAGAVAARVTAYGAGAQERLRGAELARVAALARADGERRRRRLAVALAASIIGLIVLGGASAAWWAYQRQAWLSRVAVALREAELMHERALDDPGGDAAVWEAAGAAVRRLHDLRDGGPSASVRRSIDDLEDRVERGSRAAVVDRRLVERLEEVRAGMITDDKADAAFAEAFATAGYDLDAPSADPQSIGRRLGARPRAVAAATAAALDTWAVVRRHVDRMRPEGGDGSATRRLLAAARAADPDPWRNALRDALAAGDADSLARLADDPELERRGPVGLWLLGHSLEMTGAHDRARNVLRRAQRAYPGDYWINIELGLASLEVVRSGLGAVSGWITNEGSSDARFRRAEPYLAAAVALRPRSGAAHLLLATATINQGKWDEGFAEFREAIRLQPDDAASHNGLGVAYQMQGVFEPAAAEFREAIRLQSHHTIARGNLADLLIAQGRFDEAAAALRELIAIAPAFARAHARMGQVLAIQRRPEAAAAAYREAIRLAPQYALAHSGLGFALRQLGDFTGASAALRTAFEVYPDPQWQALMRRELARTGRWAALASQWPAVLRGADPPGDGAGALELAELARERMAFAAAARWFARSFRLDPRLAEDLGRGSRYDAACCAVLAAEGRSRDEPTLDPAAASAARRSALEWLRADLAARSSTAADGPPSGKPLALQALQQWKIDPDLASVRSPGSRARLDAAARRDWESLWADLDARIAALKPDPARGTWPGTGAARPSPWFEPRPGVPAVREPILPSTGKPE